MTDVRQNEGNDDANDAEESGRRGAAAEATSVTSATETPPANAAIDIRIDWDVCMGSGNCVFLAPNSFDLGDDGHAVVLDPTATPVERLIVTAEGCPVGAISVWQGSQRLDQKSP